jgi:DNA polymerase III gamma/tau subunit
VCCAQCLELDYRKPTWQQISSRMSHVCRQEGLAVNEATLRTLIEGAQGDLRLILGQLQVRGAVLLWRLSGV